MHTYLSLNFDGAEHSPAWIECDAIDKKDAMAEFMYLGLRMTEGITRSEFETAFRVTIESVYAKELKQSVAEELLTMNAGRIALTPYGMDVSNYVLARFLQ